ncbi:hypothetical protein DFP73DRAFT_552225 [Morchella snyderi]|nr:hypothetical protein DFP73DRAFT_552225 [Morchella snyderi]
MKKVFFFFISFSFSFFFFFFILFFFSFSSFFRSWPITRQTLSLSLPPLPSVGGFFFLFFCYM